MNIATVLKDEITRVARRVGRKDTEALRKAGAAVRHDIATLKRRVLELERMVVRLAKGAGRARAAAGQEDETKIRFSRQGFATLRKRLGLSGADAGRLLDVTAQTVYNYEDGASRPRAPQLVRIAAMRKLRKRDLPAILATLPPVRHTRAGK